MPQLPTFGVYVSLRCVETPLSLHDDLLDDVLFLDCFPFLLSLTIGISRDSLPR